MLYGAVSEVPNKSANTENDNNEGVPENQGADENKGADEDRGQKMIRGWMRLWGRMKMTMIMMEAKRKLTVRMADEEDYGGDGRNQENDDGNNDENGNDGREEGKDNVNEDDDGKKCSKEENNDDKDDHNDEGYDHDEIGGSYKNDHDNEVELLHLLHPFIKVEAKERNSQSASIEP